MSFDTQDILARLDESPAPPSVRAEIAYRILNETNQRDELVNEIMTEYRLGFTDYLYLKKLEHRLSRERTNTDPLRNEAAFHLAFGMLPEDQEGMDGYLAEYYYVWAESLGIQTDKISSIIFELAFDPGLERRS